MVCEISQGTVARTFVTQEKNMMNKSVIWQLVVFVVVLLTLNFFFHLHISIIGSVVLTLGLSLVFRMIQSRS
jgi:hypothetical protein